MSELSPRFGLPLLQAGQAQKEIYHNEAVTAIEALVQPVAESLGDTTPPSSPTAGQSWIVGASPSGAWSGRADAVASWTEGGWRFTAPGDGMTFWIASEGVVGGEDGRRVAIGDSAGAEPCRRRRSGRRRAPAGDRGSGRGDDSRYGREKRRQRHSCCAAEPRVDHGLRIFSIGGNRRPPMVFTRRRKGCAFETDVLR